MFWDETYHRSPNDYDYSGNNGIGITIRSAVIDDTGFRPTHRAFRESTGSVTRLRDKFDCRNPPCVAVTSFATTGSHGTPVLGTLLGDYRDAQDSGVTTIAERERRSAPAGESEAILFRASREESDQQAAYDSMVGIAFGPNLAAIAYFKSVNQNKGGSADDCSVGHPSEAIGVFAVGGFDDNAGDTDNDTSSDTDSLCASRSALVHPDVNWGGSTTKYAEGKYRSIVALSFAALVRERPATERTPRRLLRRSGDCGA